MQYAINSMKELESNKLYKFHDYSRVFTTFDVDIVILSLSL